ncbi:MAG: hypothetical protein ACE5G8_03705, partial [Anaerolineae bacterium]
GPAPAWLTDESDIAAGAVEEAEVEPEPEPELAAEGEPFKEEDYIDSEGLPDWLQETEAVEAAAEPAPAPAAPEAAPSAVPEAPEEEMVDIEGLPDWLHETQPSAEPIPSWLAEAEQGDVGETFETAPGETEPDVPDWLKAAASEESGFTAEHEAELPESMEVGAVPEWLDESVAEEAEHPVEISEASTEQAGVPSWLEKIREDEAPAPVEKPPEPAPATAESVSPAVRLTEESLAIAKAAFAAGDIDEALQACRRLINSARELGQVIKHLSENAEKYPDNPALFEALGDAQIRDGQLNQALQSYRTALDKL